MLSFDAETAIAACRVPILYVAGARVMADLDRVRALCPQIVTGQAVGAGHFPQILVPDQVNAMIDRFLATTVLAPAAVT